MFLAATAVVLLATVPLLGGRLQRLVGIRFRGAWLLYLALALQVLVISVWRSPPPALAASAHVGTYLLAAAFLWRNRRVPGIALVALGSASNAVAIALNGGTLPASAAAVRRSGFRVADGHFANSAPLGHPHLALLGDVFVTPSWLPLRNVFSIGDVLIVVGAAVCLHVTCGSAVGRALTRQWSRVRRRRPVPAVG